MHVGERRGNRSAGSHRAAAVTRGSRRDCIERTGGDVDDRVVDRQLSCRVVDGPRNGRLGAARTLVDHAERRGALAPARPRTDVICGTLGVARLTGTGGLAVQEAATAVTDGAAVETAVRRRARPRRAVGRVVADVRDVPSSADPRCTIAAREHAAAAVADPATQSTAGRDAGGVRNAVRRHAHVAHTAEPVAARRALLSAPAAVADQATEVRRAATAADLHAVGAPDADALVAAPPGEALAISAVGLSTAQVPDHPAVAPTLRVAARVVASRGVALSTVDGDDRATGATRATRAAAA